VNSIGTRTSSVGTTNPLLTSNSTRETAAYTSTAISVAAGENARSAGRKSAEQTAATRNTAPSAEATASFLPGSVRRACVRARSIRSMPVSAA
jgi:hypothetical protein